MAKLAKVVCCTAWRFLCAENLTVLGHRKGQRSRYRDGKSRHQVAAGIAFAVSVHVGVIRIFCRGITAGTADGPLMLGFGILRPFTVGEAVRLGNRREMTAQRAGFDDIMLRIRDTFFGCAIGMSRVDFTGISTSTFLFSHMACVIQIRVVTDTIEFVSFILCCTVPTGTADGSLVLRRII